MIATSLLVLLTLLVSFHLYTRYNHRGRLYNEIPGPRAYPIIGNALLYCNVSDPHDFWTRARADKMDSETVRDYKQAIHDMGQVVVYRLVRPYILDWMLPYLTDWGNYSTGGRYLVEHNTDEGEDSSLDEGLSIGRKKRLAMLDHLIAIERKGLINEKGLQEEVDTITFGGHDTTAAAVTFTLMLLAENPERTRAEVTRLVGANDGKIGNAEVQEFRYLERCIKESLRLYPPISTIMRYTSEELQLKHALIPRDTHVIVHFWDTHRDPNFWPDPDKFDPDRFLPDNAKGRHPFAYLPFSAGPRNCIGQKLAMMMLKSLIGRIVYEYALLPVDRTTDLRLIADIVLRPLDPVRMRFVKISQI